MNYKVAFLVVSCDHYCDLWPIFFKTFYKYWSDFPYQLYLASNFKQYDDEKVINISFGEDQPFSTNLINIIKKIDEDNIILWFEDAFLTKKVNSSVVTSIIEKFISSNNDHLKLTVDYPLFYGKKNELFGPIPKGVKYRSAIGMALYKKSTLNQILVPGESAWELDKTTRIDKLDLKFNSLNSDLRFNRPFSVINSVIKGKWIFNGPKFLKKEGFSNLIKSRKRQSLKDFIYIQLFLFRIEIFFLFKKYWYNK